MTTPKTAKKRSGTREGKAANPDPRLPLLAVDSAGRPFANLDNAIRLLQEKSFTYDSFANQVYMGDEPLVDKHLLLLQRWIQQVALPKIPKDTVVDAIRYVAFENSHDPPKEYLEKLSWDGVPRLATFWQTYYGADMDAEYLGAIGPNWWISMVARVLKPGCKVDTMPVLEGLQGKYKSTSLSIIGGDWFAENTQDIGTKDFYMGLHGKLLIEIPELDKFDRTDVTTVKRILSCSVDHYRVPWGRFPEGFKRRSVFAGTTNKDEWARDDTGERRFWPVACKKLDLDLLAQDRDQLWAEAKHRFDSGESWWVVPDIADSIQRERHEEDVWEPEISRWLDRRAHTVTTSEVLDIVIKVRLCDQGRTEQMRVAKVMRKLGWIKEKKGTVLWHPPINNSKAVIPMEAKSPDLEPGHLAF